VHVVPSQMAAGAPHKHCRAFAMQFHNGVVVAARAGELDAHPYLLSVGARCVKQTRTAALWRDFRIVINLPGMSYLRATLCFWRQWRVLRGAVIRRVSVLGVLENVDQVSTGVHSLHTHRREPATF
jgi:hypothetical protein